LTLYRLHPTPSSPYTVFTATAVISLNNNRSPLPRRWRNEGWRRWSPETTTGLLFRGDDGM